jgi:hypothetical protein
VRCALGSLNAGFRKPKLPREKQSQSALTLPNVCYNSKALASPSNRPVCQLSQPCLLLLFELDGSNKKKCFEDGISD